MSTTALSLPRRFASLVKLEHTVFALPFAYVGAFLAVDGFPGVGPMVWLTLAMVGARTLAMALEPARRCRARRPEPADGRRELPAGALPGSGVGLCAAALALYLVAAFQLEPIVRWLWPIPVAMFVVYPYLKRVTWLCHLWLGACTGLAPLGAWIAVTGRLPGRPGRCSRRRASGSRGSTSSTRSSTSRTTGRRASSWATRFGERGVFVGARLFHVVAVALLAAVGVGLGSDVFYWLGVARGRGTAPLRALARAARGSPSVSTPHSSPSTA